MIQKKIRNGVCGLINGKNINEPDMEGRKRGRRKCVREGRLLCEGWCERRKVLV
jgi:hypothetical protein